MVSICFDIGNTHTKVAVFKNSAIESFRVIDTGNYPMIAAMIDEHKVEMAIISSVSVIPDAVVDMLRNKSIGILQLDHTTALPIDNLYETKETLGKDRLAAAVGAHFLYPEADLLIIDAGTAITYDIITSSGQYLGGNISPGLQMRYKALNYYTNRLPLLEPSDTFPVFGKNTTEAIRAGVQNGIIFEVDATIDLFRQQYPGSKILLTGGDAKFFDKKLKNIIFVVSNLVMIGLNKILIYNAQKS